MEYERTHYLSDSTIPPRLAVLRSGRRSTLLARRQGEGACHQLCEGLSHRQRHDAVTDAQQRPGFQIRILNAAGEIEESIAFDERANRMRV